jgi:hypothetical protein
VLQPTASRLFISSRALSQVWVGSVGYHRTIGAYPPMGG